MVELFSLSRYQDSSVMIPILVTSPGKLHAPVDVVIVLLFDAEVHLRPLFAVC